MKVLFTVYSVCCNVDVYCICATSELRNLPHFQIPTWNSNSEGHYITFVVRMSGFLTGTQKGHQALYCIFGFGFSKHLRAKMTFVH